MDYETVQVQRRGAELRIVEDRPEAMNAWNTQFGLDLRSAVEGLRTDEGARRDHRRRGRAFSSAPTSRPASTPRPPARPTSTPR